MPTLVQASDGQVSFRFARTRAGFVTGGLLFAELLTSSRVFAAGHFSAPPGCANRPEFERAIRERVGSEGAALLNASDLDISAQPDGGYRLLVRVNEDSRILQDPNCEALFRAAIVIAVALWDTPSRPSLPETPVSATPEPNGPQSLPQSRPATAVATVMAPSGVSGPWGQVEPHLAPNHPRARDWFLGVESGLTLGLQPSPGLLLGLRGALETSRIGLDISLRGFVPNERRDASQRGVEVSAAGLRVAGSVMPITQLALEFGVAGYGLYGRGLGSRSDTSDVVVCFGPLMGVRLVPWRTDWLELSLGAEAQLVMNRPHFEVLEYGRVFEVSRVLGSGYLSAGTRFR